MIDLEHDFPRASTFSELKVMFTVDGYNSVKVKILGLNYARNKFLYPSEGQNDKEIL
jgi:hypothetical protein